MVIYAYTKKTGVIMKSKRRVVKKADGTEIRYTAKKDGHAIGQYKVTDAAGKLVRRIKYNEDGTKEVQEDTQFPHLVKPGHCKKCGGQPKKQLTTDPKLPVIWICKDCGKVIKTQKTSK
jgi:hypothetical protein